MIEWPFVSHIDAYIARQAALLVPEHILKQIRISKLTARDTTRRERGLPKVHQAEIAALQQQLIDAGVTVASALAPTSADM